jgi:hypothetical protein
MKAVVLAATMVATPCLAAPPTWEPVGTINGSSMWIDTSNVIDEGRARRAWFRLVPTDPTPHPSGKPVGDALVYVELRCSTRYWTFLRKVVRSTEASGSAELSNVGSAYDPKPVTPGSFDEMALDAACELRAPLTK